MAERPSWACTALIDSPPVTAWLATECRPNLSWLSIRIPSFRLSRWVPDDDRGATIVANGVVEKKLAHNLVVFRMTATAQGETVMTGARVVARLA